MGLSNYLLYSIIPLLICLWAQFKVKKAFSKYGAIGTHSMITGAQAARTMLDEHGLTDVRIEHIGGTLSDHYDPMKKVLRVSGGGYSSTSIAAVGVACHEAGHAYQHAEHYQPLVLRTSIVPMVNLGGSLGPIIFMLGLMLTSVLGYSNFGYDVAKIGLIIFCLTAVFAIITLPVEFNASSRAKQWLSDAGFLDSSELEGVNDMLSAAAMTYVSAAIQSVATILYYASMLNNNENRNIRRRR